MKFGAIFGIIIIVMQNPYDVNLLKPESEIGYKSPKKRRGKFFIIFIVLILVIFFGSRIIVNWRSPSYPEENQTFLGRLTTLVLGERRLKGEWGGRVNILFLGIGGPGHEGPFLTDTMILASIRPGEKDISLVSIPRDLLVEVPDVGMRKINEADAFGELKEVGSGGDAAREVVGETFDLSVDYYVRLDFAGFKKIVDDVGGVIIDVPQSFSDSLYPDNAFGYQTVSFRAGKQLMDGERALQFVRSRHGTNGEGSDFSRSRRQQLLMVALKDRLLSMDTILNPSKVVAVMESVSDHLKTNLSFWEIIRLASIGRTLDYGDIHRVVLAEGDGYPLQAEMRDGAYVLTPKVGDWSEVRGLVRDIFNAPVAAAEELGKKERRVVVDVQNGTNITGLAYQTSLKLTELGFEVGQIKNSARRDFTKTVIYDFSGGKYKDALVNLRKNLDANIAIDIPAWVKNSATPAEGNGAPDFVIILGKES